MDGLFGGMKIAKRSIILVQVLPDGPVHGPSCVIGETGDRPAEVTERLIGGVVTQRNTSRVTRYNMGRKGGDAVKREIVREQGACSVPYRKRRGLLTERRAMTGGCVLTDGRLVQCCT